MRDTKHYIKNREFIQSKGFIYDPFKEEYSNLFIGQKIKSDELNGFNFQVLKKTIEFMLESYIKKNQKFKSFEEICDSLTNGKKRNKLDIFIEGYAGVIGIILLFLTFIPLFYLSMDFALIILIASFISTNFYLTENLLEETRGKASDRSEWWYKYKSFITIICMIQYPYLYFLLFNITQSFWIPVPIIFAIKTAILIISTKNRSRLFWRNHGLPQILEIVIFNKDENFGWIENSES